MRKGCTRYVVIIINESLVDVVCVSLRLSPLSLFPLFFPPSFSKTLPSPETRNIPSKLFPQPFPRIPPAFPTRSRFFLFSKKWENSSPHPRRCSGECILHQEDIVLTIPRGFITFFPPLFFFFLPFLFLFSHDRVVRYHIWDVRVHFTYHKSVVLRISPPFFVFFSFSSFSVSFCLVWFCSALPCSSP